MSTEQGFQSRGGKRRHIKLRPAPVGGGSRQAMGIPLAAPQPSAKEVNRKAQRSRLRIAASELGEISEKERIIGEWLDALNPLERENAELLLRQEEIDRSAAERALGYDPFADESTDDGPPGGFLHFVVFDREDDVWPYVAASHRKTQRHVAHSRKV